MSGFSADWLALREPADVAARSAAACAAIARRADPLEIVDLGAGTGASLRYLAPRLGGRQRWRLVDDDAGVLSRVGGALREWADAQGFGFAETAGGVRVEGRGFDCDVECVRADLATDRTAWAAPRSGLVTASALLDLVSADWLGALAARCAAADAAVLFALTYDGRMRFAPAEAHDALVRDLVNRHQRGDKGFGPALGPDASTTAVAAFEARGYAMRIETADWRLGADATALQTALLDGWLGAAVEIAPAERNVLTAWHRRRIEHVAAGRSRLVVGHVDIAGARPAQRRAGPQPIAPPAT